MRACFWIFPCIAYMQHSWYLVDPTPPQRIEVVRFPSQSPLPPSSVHPQRTDVEWDPLWVGGSAIGAGRVHALVVGVWISFGVCSLAYLFVCFFSFCLFHVSVMINDLSEVFNPRIWWSISNPLALTKSLTIRLITAFGIVWSPRCAKPRCHAWL